MQKKTGQEISFVRAYRAWRHSGAEEENEFGEGRAFYRWLEKLKLSINWTKDDFKLHPYFCHPYSPRHDPDDDLAKDLSFAIKPVMVKGRKVKLYIEDKDVLALIHLNHGKEEDFLELVTRYVAQRFEWSKWQVTAPNFWNWIVAQGCRPSFKQGQLGLHLKL
jgi:hypothetical protein